MVNFDRRTYLKNLEEVIKSADASAAEASTEIAPVKRRLQEGGLTYNYTLQDATAAMAALHALVCKATPIDQAACAETSATLGVPVKEAFEPIFTASDPSNTGSLNTINGGAYKDEDIAIAVVLSVSRIDRP